MGILSWLFEKPKTVTGTFQWQTSAPVVFTGDAYEQRTVRSIIDTIATHCAKAEALHVIVDKNGKIKSVEHNSAYARLLNQQPNPWMSAFDFKYKLAASLEATTTALVYVRWAGNIPAMFMPINYSTAEIYPTAAGSYAIKFFTNDGEKYTLPIEDVIVLRKFFQKSDLWGDGNLPIYSALNLIKAGDQAFSEAMSVSNKMRGLLKQKKAMLDPKDVEMEADLFAERYIRAAGKGGILGVDQGAEYIPLDVKPSSATVAQMKEVREELYRYWHVSDSILMSDYTPEKWQAFYESVLEPRFIAMGEAFSNICFTPTERAHGNRIMFTSSMLLHTSVDTKINLIRETKEIGLLTINEIRGLIGYSPVEDGDVRAWSLNYTNTTDDTGNKQDVPVADDVKQSVEATLEEDETISQVSLNGAQIQSLLQIVQAVVNNELEYDSAITLIVSAFPFDEETAKKILGNPKNLTSTNDTGSAGESEGEDAGS